MNSWIDVSRAIDERIIQWPSDPRYRIWQVSKIKGPGTANVSAISTSVHLGTHVDAPLHYLAEGGDVAGLALEKLCGPAVVIHVRAARDVQVEDLERAGLASGERVLLRTANEDLWSRGEFDEHFFGISAPAAEWLAHRGVPAVGIDYLSVDRYDAADRPAHYALLGAGVVIIEGLDLSGVDEGRYEMIALPLKLVGSDGSPARVILRRAQAPTRFRAESHAASAG